jgi:hypothetical protein
MGTRDSHPGGSPDVVTFGWGWGRERVPRRWPWTRERAPRRWPWIMGAVLLAAAVGTLIVVRPLVAAADFRALRARWSAAVALDLGRSEVIVRLIREATPSDVDAVSGALLAVQRQEADRLVVLRAEVTPGLARDEAVGVLAAAERAALSREIADLRGAPLTAWSLATELAIRRVQTLLAAGQQRFGVPAPTSPRPARLTAADSTLLRLRRLLDDTVPVRLLVVAGRRVQIIDLRSGSITAPPSALRRLGRSLAQGGPVLPRAGFLAVQVGFRVYAVKPAFAGTPRLLGTGQLLPAGRPGAVWILGASGRGVMVSGTGRRIAGPVPELSNLPGSRVYANVTGLAVSDGLVIEKDHRGATGNPVPAGLWLWNPPRGQELRRLVAGCAHAVAAQGRLLVWVGCGQGDPARVRLHVTDTVTGADRVVANPPGAIPFLADQPTAAFSPNGRWLAAYYSVKTSTGGIVSTGYALGLVDTRTGVTSIIRGAPVADATVGTVIRWTGDSTRVFFATGAFGFNNNQPWADSSVPLATYRIGERSAVDLRLHEPGAALLAVLPVR